MKNRKRKKSGRVIAVLLFLILAAAIVLAAVWFGVLKDVILPPSTEQASVDTSEAVPAEPAATPEQVTELTPEPTPEPTVAPTPEPVKTLSYSSSYTPLGTGMISSGEYEGVSFRENTRVTDAGGKELSVSEDGKSVGTISLDGYVTGLVKLSDGRVGALSWIDNAQKLFILNAASDAVEETVDLPSSAVCFADGCGPYSYYYSDGVNFYGVDLATKSEKVLFNWTAVDVSGTRVSAINTEDGNVFRCLVNAWRDDLLSYEASFVTITGSENAPAEKKELVLLSGSPMDTLQDAIVSFNRSHDDTRIVLRTLGQASEANPLAALRKIAREEGKMPDLIDLTGMPYQTLASSGLLEDLTPYLEQDGELTLNALVPQVFSALQVNSKIYGTASGFSLTTVLGPSRVLKGMDGWTFQQYNNIASTLGDGNYAFGSADTQASLLYDVLGMNLNRFVNWNDLTCHFDNTDFSRILEFIKRLPAEPRGTNDAEQIQSKVQLLYRAPARAEVAVVVRVGAFRHCRKPVRARKRQDQPEHLLLAVVAAVGRIRNDSRSRQRVEINDFVPDSFLAAECRRLVQLVPRNQLRPHRHGHGLVAQLLVRRAQKERRIHAGRERHDRAVNCAQQFLEMCQLRRHVLNR